ncbi:MAG: hypothetical protein A2Z72_06475 [Omnitrophica bacterium RBG_13_46_9]|nr:MAG: hypothetical protein A2Z72_06475 [Omnitrophica bacterium RBG_13_46_9]
MPREEGADDRKRSAGRPSNHERLTLILKEAINMFTFNIVRRIGEGNYLSEDWFIIERIRKERALNGDQTKSRNNANNPSKSGKNEKQRFS